MIIFFYVDDIVICYWKKDEKMVKNIIIDLKIRYMMNELESFKWFLGIHVLWDRAKKLFWLSQESYIDKIANQYCIDLTGKMPSTPMTNELYLYDEKASNAAIRTYQ